MNAKKPRKNSKEQTKPKESPSIPSSPVVDTTNYYGGFTPPPRSQHTDLKWMLRYAGYVVSEDGKRYTKVYPGKTKAKSFDFLEGDQIKIGYVNKETNEAWAKELHISDTFNHIK